MFQQRFLFPKMMGKATDQAIVDNILTHGMPPVLDYLESIAPESGYFVGNALSIADISVVTCFLQVQYADFAVDAQRYPKLGRYLAAGVRVADRHRTDGKRARRSRQLKPANRRAGWRSRATRTRNTPRR